MICVSISQEDGNIKMWKKVGKSSDKAPSDKWENVGKLKEHSHPSHDVVHTSHPTVVKNYNVEFNI